MPTIFNKKLVVFDLETTSIVLGQPEIVEIGAVLLDTTLEELDSFSMLVRPSNLDLFDSFCENLTGIFVEELEKAPKFVDVWRKFADFTNWKDSILSAWGTHFDVPILRNEYTRLNLEFPHKSMPFDVKSAVQFWCAREGWRPKTWRLSEVAKKFELPVFEPAHRALNDARTTVSVLRHICA